MCDFDTLFREATNHADPFLAVVKIWPKGSGGCPLPPGCAGIPEHSGTWSWYKSLGGSYDPPDNAYILRCCLPPRGQKCSRPPGHEGPCATTPDIDQAIFSHMIGNRQYVYDAEEAKKMASRNAEKMVNDPVIQAWFDTLVAYLTTKHFGGS